jgi:hypothetical protein
MKISPVQILEKELASASMAQLPHRITSERLGEIAAKALELKIVAAAAADADLIQRLNMIRRKALIQRAMIL